MDTGMDTAGATGTVITKRKSRMNRPNTVPEEDWDLQISPRVRILNLHLREIWHYKDLLFLFVRRDFIAIYKQTVLGPVWHVIQPVLTTIVFLVIFHRVAHIPTDGIPPALFYFSGLTIWQFFSKCLTTSSGAFISNAHIFSKVHFPRLIMPLASMFSALIAFLIQSVLLALIYFWFVLKGFDIKPNVYMALLPVLVLVMAMLGLGFGIIISSLTTKYRDLSYFVSFGTQLLMYATPVIYPISAIPQKYQNLLYLNPMAPVVEGFKYALTGSGTFSILLLLYSLGVAMVIFFIAILLFNRIETRFVDTL